MESQSCPSCAVLCRANTAHLVAQVVHIRAHLVNTTVQLSCDSGGLLRCMCERARVWVRPTLTTSSNMVSPSGRVLADVGWSFGVVSRASKRSSMRWPWLRTQCCLRDEEQSNRSNYKNTTNQDFFFRLVLISFDNIELRFEL